MQRRRYLALAGVSMTVLAGCSEEEGGGDNGSDGTETAEMETLTETAEPTATATTEPPADETTMVETEAETEPETETETPTSTETETETEAMMETETTDSATATTASGGTGSTTVSDSELVVEEGEFGTDVYMTGIVENTGSDTLRLPEARVTFYDDSESILDTSTASIYFLEPGTRWEIYEPYLDDTEPASGEIEVTSADTYQTELGIPDPLNIAEENLRTGEEPALDLRVENTSDSTVSPAVFCVFYDGDGIALGDGLDSLDELPAGESWQTTLELLAYSTQDSTRVSDYDLYANLL